MDGCGEEAEGRGHGVVKPLDSMKTEMHCICIDLKGRLQSYRL
jgi:hypothetical protein